MNRALEWFERGRCVIWSHTLRLRAPASELRSIAPELVSEKERIVEQLIKAENGMRKSHRYPGQLQSSMQHNLLASELDELLSKARGMQELHGFLSPKTPRELQEITKLGPVVVLNACEQHCDAFELNLIKKVPANPLKVELPRITWCVSGPFAFLPLHAAGIYDQDQSCCLSAFDYAVHSYTPSLSALYEALSQSNARPPHSLSDEPPILAISQPHSPSQMPLPGTLAEVSAIKLVAGDRLTWLNGPEATQAAVLALIDKHPWVHLACHGVQDTRKPTQSAFMLHDGGLTMHTLMRRSVVPGEKSLAVLSACQTATGDESVPEEVVHLAAGMLMTGFQSVVATMWSVDDYDAPIVMEAFYSHLLNEGRGDSAQSCRALHHAIKRLQEKVGVRNVLKWAPFIHLGV
ncbi:hypothetical protein PENSPDRAFT_635616 [Peniophora sp. CONT]|nr:hypothetical protein PENSPDRAFT_635616 [Peniophora sp. CONT]